jgi:hypothetical protein
MGKSSITYYNLSDFSDEELENIKDALRYIGFVFDKHKISLSKLFLFSSKEIKKSCTAELRFRRECIVPFFELPF